MKSAADLKCARDYMARRRAAVRQAKAVVGKDYVEPTLALVYERDEGICYLCGGRCSPLGSSHRDTRRPTMDHVLALANGGLHTFANIALACYACNRRKSTALVEEYTAQLVAIEQE